MNIELCISLRRLWWTKMKGRHNSEILEGRMEVKSVLRIAYSNKNSFSSLLCIVSSQIFDLSWTKSKIKFVLKRLNYFKIFKILLQLQFYVLWRARSCNNTRILWGLVILCKCVTITKITNIKLYFIPISCTKKLGCSRS